MQKAMIQLPITLDQLITTVQQLQPSDRAQVAKALIQIELKSDRPLSLNLEGHFLFVM